MIKNMYVFTKVTDIKIMHMNRIMISLYLSPWDSLGHSASRTIGVVTNTRFVTGGNLDLSIGKTEVCCDCVDRVPTASVDADETSGCPPVC